MPHSQTPLIPTILCGGAGSRLWPLSRDEYPKQLLPLVGKETMLRSTIRRISNFVHDKAKPASAPIIVCNENHRFLVAEQIKDISTKGTSIILEPFARNTAPALTVAALYAMRDGYDPLLLVMPADHIITNVSAFHDAVSKGIEPALMGNIVTFGIIPDRPETGYGYIKINQSNTVADQVFPIIRFVEKPDFTTAESYLATEEYYWNSGMFILRAGTWIQAIQQLQPSILEACKNALNKGSCDFDFYRLNRDFFSTCPTDSIDYAVMEKLGVLSDSAIRGIMVAMDAGWSDVGAWDAVWKIGEKDVKGNISFGDVILENSKNSLILASSRLVSCVGIDGLAVIETPDALLIANKDKSQEVKKIVDILKASGRREGSSHRKVYRPWGWYDSLEQSEDFQVKRIVINPGAILSLQLHRHRSEHWIVVRGMAEITLGEEIIQLKEDQSIYIPVGEKHRVGNPGEVPLEIIEVQTGDYLGEDDIIRFEDKYGREQKDVCM